MTRKFANFFGMLIVLALAACGGMVQSAPAIEQAPPPPPTMVVVAEATPTATPETPEPPASSGSEFATPEMPEATRVPEPTPAVQGLARGSQDSDLGFNPQTEIKVVFLVGPEKFRVIQNDQSVQQGATGSFVFSRTIWGSQAGADRLFECGFAGQSGFLLCLTQQAPPPMPTGTPVPSTNG